MILMYVVCFKLFYILDVDLDEPKSCALQHLPQCLTNERLIRPTYEDSSKSWFP